MTLPGEEFLRRFLLHVLPKGFMRIRHYGYLANRVRVKQIKNIREALKKEPTIKAVITKQAKNNGPLTLISTSILTTTNKERKEHCPKCKTGYLYLIGEILSERERRRYSLTN